MVEQKYKQYSLGVAPSQDASDHQDCYIFSRGILINLYLPLLLGAGHTQNILPDGGEFNGDLMMVESVKENIKTKRTKGNLVMAFWLMLTAPN